MPATLVIGEPNFTTTNSPQPCFSVFPPPQQSVTGRVFNYNDKFAFDRLGNLWIADGGNNRVLEFRPPFSTGMSASLVIGQANFTSGAPDLTARGLDFPTEPAFDPSGNLWIADINNNRIVEYAPPFSNGMSATLVVGQSGLDSRVACATTQNGFCGVDSIAFDSLGNLWATDFNNRILQFKPPFSNSMNASLVIGQMDFVTNAAAAGKSGLNFSTGSGFAFDSAGNLWVGDSGNNRVLEFKPAFRTGMEASLVLGQLFFETTSEGTSRFKLSIPVEPGFDAFGNIWVPDAGNNRVLKFSLHRF
jgi:sugar lactone lactonase YvrE